MGNNYSNSLSNKNHHLIFLQCPTKGSGDEQPQPLTPFQQIEKENQEWFCLGCLCFFLYGFNSAIFQTKRWNVTFFFPQIKQIFQTSLWFSINSSLGCKGNGRTNGAGWVWGAVKRDRQTDYERKGTGTGRGWTGGAEQEEGAWSACSDLVT